MKKVLNVEVNRTDDDDVTLIIGKTTLILNVDQAREIGDALVLIDPKHDAGEGEESFVIVATMRTRWIATFMGMLETMRYLGAIGSSRYVKIFSDGDGDFRPMFSTSLEHRSVDNPEWMMPSETAMNEEAVFDAG